MDTHPKDQAEIVITAQDEMELESAIPFSSQSDFESKLAPWVCVVGACIFSVPSFGKFAHSLRGEASEYRLALTSPKGFMQSVGTLQNYLQLNQLEGYSTGDIGWITGIYMFLSYSFTIQIGPICDHYGPMVVGLVGVICTIASFLLLGECQTYWQIMLCLGVLGSLGGAIIATVAMACVAKLFSRRRGLAMGLTLAGSAIGSIIFPILLRSTLATRGWRWSLRITALVTAGILLPGLLCFARYNQLMGINLPVGSHSRRKQATINFAAFRSAAFSFVAVGSFLLEFAIFGIAGLLPTMATETGFTPEDAYVLPAIVGASSLPGRVLPGLLGDFVGPFNSLLIMTTTTLLFMATLFIPFASKSHNVLYAFSALWGFGSGAFLSVTPGTSFNVPAWRYEINPVFLFLTVCMGKTCEAKDYGRFYGKYL